MPHVVRAYDHDPRSAERGVSYGMEAALALGVDPRTVFKTLVADVDGALTVADLIRLTGARTAPIARR